MSTLGRSFAIDAEIRARSVEPAVASGLWDILHEAVLCCAASGWSRPEADDGLLAQQA